MVRHPKYRWHLITVTAIALAAPAFAATITVNSTADDFDQGPNGNCTLREAVLAANTNAAVDACPAGDPGPSVTDRVVVPAGTYVLTIAGAGEDAGEQGDLDLLDSVSIEGAGARLTEIDAAGNDRVFQVHGGTAAALVDLVLFGGLTPDAGGGVLNGGTLTVQRCTVAGNGAGGPGGGIRNDADLFVLESTIRDNATTDHGGGVDDHGLSHFVNVTVSGNEVFGGGAGGGLYNLGGTAMTVSASTVVDNSAAVASAIHNGGTLTVDNLLVVGSCDAPVTTSDGGSLESPGDSCGFDAATDQVDVANALLGLLADNGGPTDTHFPLAGSPAIDRGLNSQCPSRDQRGVLRPLDGDGDDIPECDVGAVEVELLAAVFSDGFESGDTGAWSSVQNR